jgi:putative endonuclease
MHYAYVIYSPSFSRFYKGHCNNLGTKLSGHNSGNTISTKKYRPWQLVYFESYNSLEEAIKREKYFKTSAGGRFIKFKINLSISNGGFIK